MNRKILIFIIVVGVILIALVGTLIGIKLINRSAVSTGSMTADQVENSGIVVRDKYANREDDAINIVKNFKVYAPDYIDAYAKAKENGENTAALEPKMVTIESLVEDKLLEKSFNMSYLKKGEWRALHLDTDTGEEQIPDPQYEVYLDYHDESVVVGPVWIVDLKTGLVIPRNHMASVFNRTKYNYKEVKENIERPASVIRAIVSHKFDNGIDLGGVFLLHFLQLANKPNHENDRIIGWTVMQEFKDDYSAYFQWVVADEVRVAKFKFNWETKSLTPRGLLAVDLMALGDNMKTLRPADIFPKAYTNDLYLKRPNRWAPGAPCRANDSSSKRLCNALVTVFEQQEFITAMEWLVTDGKEDGARAIDDCKKEQRCGWKFKLAEGDLNPKNDENLYEISYKYELNNHEHFIRLIVNSETEVIKPLDKISQWAYWSVAPRT